MAILTSNKNLSLMLFGVENLLIFTKFIKEKFAKLFVKNWLVFSKIAFSKGLILFVCVSCACFSYEKILRKTWPPPLEIVGYILLLKYLNKNLSDFFVLHIFCQQLFRKFSFIYVIKVIYLYNKSKFDLKTLWKKICFASMPKKK